MIRLGVEGDTDFAVVVREGVKDFDLTNLALRRKFHS